MKETKFFKMTIRKSRVRGCNKSSSSIKESVRWKGYRKRSKKNRKSRYLI